MNGLNKMPKCIFCNSELMIINNNGGHTNAQNAKWWLECKNNKCAAIGPWANSKTEAIEKYKITRKTIPIDELFPIENYGEHYWEDLDKMDGSDDY